MVNLADCDAVGRLFCAGLKPDIFVTRLTVRTHRHIGKVYRLRHSSQVNWVVVAGVSVNVVDYESIGDRPMCQLVDSPVGKKMLPAIG